MAGDLRHLLSIDELDQQSIVKLLDSADRFYRELMRQPARKYAALSAHLVMNLFLEPSTRTRVSFEVAAKRLGADCVNFTIAGSSAAKGETLLDTVQNLEAMKPQVFVIRHSESGAAHWVAKRVSAAVVNAGDGTNEHPTQALLDCATMRAKKGRVEGLEVAIVGDITHSRVAHSDIRALKKLGAKVRVTGPRTMIPQGVESLGVHVAQSLQEAVEGADVVMMLRIQQERMGGQCLFASNRDYARSFGLNSQSIKWCKPDVLVMAPGPINRGVELSSDVADGPQSVILDQVTYGVAVRMAVLHAVTGEQPLG